MSATVLYMSISLDGFIAGPNESPENGLGDGGHRLHEWLMSEGDLSLDAVSEAGGVNGQIVDEFLATGAIVAGKGTFEPAGGWGGDHHDGAPIFIVSRSRPGIEIDQWPLVSYLADVGVAMARAKEAAGERNVLVHGAGITRLALAAGVLDELELHVIPVLFGQGRRLFEGLPAEQVELEPTRVLRGEGGVTHLRYRVCRRAASASGVARSATPPSQGWLDECMVSFRSSPLARRPMKRCRRAKGPALVNSSRRLRTSRPTQRKELMISGNGFAAGGARRRLALTGLALAAVLTMCVGSAALKPADAKAWAWKDTCTLIVFNKTGQQSSVRPILYTPLLPNPASMAEYAAFAITGIPTSGAAAFTNTGYPAPSYGCHTFMNFTNPGPTVSCKVSAPTTGANTFSCEGNATTRIIKDDDDIAGNIFVPSGSGSPGPKPAEPQPGPAALRAGALPGEGWRKSQKITDFGIAGKLMDDGTLPSSCGKDGDEIVPDTVSSEQLVRGGSEEGVGAIVGRYDSPAQAKRAVGEVLSNQSIDCLAKLLNSADTQVAARPLPAAAEGDEVDGSQLVISRQAGGDWRPIAYLNVIGWTDGDEGAIQLVETVGAAPDAADEDAAIGAVRIG